MFKIITSQLKVVPGKEQSIEDYELSSAMMFKNEAYSFQVVYSADALFQPVTLEIDSPLPAESHRVDLVPISHAANEYNEPGYVISEPGAVPDLLLPRPLKAEIRTREAFAGYNIYVEENVKNTLNATREMQSVLVTLNPDGKEIAPGKYTVKITMRELAELKESVSESLEIEVMDVLLPKSDVCVTSWFHVDCLCDYYGCEPYSDRFYEIFRTFVRNMTRHGQNTLLTPAFTPALDTPVGDERRNVQLVDVDFKDGKWSFDFERLAYFMKTAAECGIKYFEHSHFFSQWGAASTPNIYDRDGKKIFGWGTDATSPDYTEFIRAYIKAFIDFARGEGYSDSQLLFHISDEPEQEMLEGYKKAAGSVSDLLENFRCIDALSNIDFYQMGLCKNPVAATKVADDFYGKCDSLWLYYTGAPSSEMCSNRLITNTPGRTRILGAQLYHYRAQGFLQWGYNYYYDRMSQGVVEPKSNPCGYKNIPGCSFLAYPEREGAVPSFREIHMRECFDDLRALKLYESLTSFEETEKFMEQSLGHVDIKFIPEGNKMHEFSQALKQAIKSKF